MTLTMQQFRFSALWNPPQPKSTKLFSDDTCVVKIIFVAYIYDTDHNMIQIWLWYGR